MSRRCCILLSRRNIIDVFFKKKVHKQSMGCRPKVWNPLMKKGYINSSNKPAPTKGLISEEDEQMLEKTHAMLMELEESSKKVYKSVKKHHDRLINIQKEDSKISSYLLNSPAFEENEDLQNIAEIYQKTAYQLGKVTQEFVETTSRVFVEPVKTFHGSFQDVAGLIKKRDSLLNECLKNKVKKEKLEYSSSTDKIKLEQAKLTFQSSYDEFINSNEELKKELPLLYEIREKFVDPCVEAYCHAQAEYYMESTRLFAIMTFTLDPEGIEVSKSDEDFKKDVEELLEELKSIDIVDGTDLVIKNELLR